MKNTGGIMKKGLINGVPRYFETYVNDCFHNAYSAVIQYMGLNPKILMADYMSFMYDGKNDLIGVNYLYRQNTTVEFTEEDLNTSLEFAYLPKTSYFSKVLNTKEKTNFIDRININMFIDEDPVIAHTELKRIIDNGKPVVAAVDLFYMKYHRAYQKEHGIHCIVITGYNEEEGYYELFDKYKHSSSDFDGRVPIGEVQQARMSDNPLWDKVSKRPIRNLWMEITADKNFRVSEEKLINVLTESCKRMSGEKEVLGYKCGLNMLDAFISDLLVKQQGELTEPYWYRAYLNINFKNLARNRIRFKVFICELSTLLPIVLITEMVDLLEEASKHWDICSSIALKLGIKKSLDLIDDLVKHLRIIRDLEQCILEKLSNVLLCYK